MISFVYLDQPLELLSTTDTTQGKSLIPILIDHQKMTKHHQSSIDTSSHQRTSNEFSTKTVTLISTLQQSISNQTLTGTTFQSKLISVIHVDKIR